MEAAINSSMQRGNNHDYAIKEATRQMRRGSSHIHLKLNPYQIHCSGFKIQFSSDQSDEEKTSADQDKKLVINLMKKKLQQIRMKT
ncbi:hypothetical protein Gotur_024693 [Gossypium turneri]